MAEPELAFLQDLAVVFLVAAVTTVLFYRLRQPVILGYIVAGLIVSPHTPPGSLVSSLESIRVISELGLVFLLFSLGLEWSLGAVRRLGPGFLLATPVEVGIMTAGGYGLGLLLGWTHVEALLFGVAISVSSTAIILKTLNDQNEVEAPHGRAALGVNVVEDIIAVAVISQVPAFLSGTAVGLDDVLLNVGKLLLFVAVTVVVGYLLVPRLVSHVARFHVSDVLVVTLVGLAFGVAILASQLGFAAGLGAFLAGFLIAGSERLTEVREKVEPLRDVFGAVFFVSIGMLLDPALILAHWPLVLLGATGVILLKPLAVSFSLVLVGRGGFHATRAGLYLVPIGEMSFVIAGAAAAAGYAPALLSVLTGIALVTALVGPQLAARTQAITGLLQRRTPRILVSFSQQYAQWSARLARRALPDPAYRRAVGRRSWRVGLNAGIVLALFVGGLVAASFAPPAFELAGTQVPATLLFLAAAAVLSVPPLTLAVLNAREVHELVTEGMTPERFWESDDERGVVSRVVRDTVGAALLILVAVLVLLGALPFFPAPPVLVLFVLLLSGALLLFFDAALALHVRVQHRIETAFTTALPAEARDEVQELLSSQYPWGVVFEEALVGRGSKIAGRPLGELGVRAATGATVVSIRRGERTIVNPGPDQMLVEGDRVLVAGEPSQVVQARDLLTGGPDLDAHLGEVGAETLEVKVSRQSVLAGQSLRKANLRASTGAVVLAIVRGGRMASHPGPDEVLQPGDRLLLVGTPEQLERARERLGAERPTGEETAGGSAGE